MCFYNDDYDWYAQINEQTFIRGDSQEHCLECGRTIAAGEWRTFIYQQEQELCQICEDTESDDYDREQDAATCKHDYGETYSASICRECGLLLAAIYDLERIEGCPEHARQPRYGELGEELSHDDERKYAQHAIVLFPELATHELLKVET